MQVIEMVREIFVVFDRVLPESRLPEAAAALPLPDVCERLWWLFMLTSVKLERVLESTHSSERAKTL